MYRNDERPTTTSMIGAVERILVVVQTVDGGSIIIINIIIVIK
jgi:hypothetical protein